MKLFSISTALSVTALTFLLFSSAPPVSAQTAPVYTLTEIGTLPGMDNGHAKDINNRGEVAGETSLAGYYKNSFYWSKATGIIAIPLINGAAYATVKDINEAGEVLSSTESAWIWKYGVNNSQPMPLNGFTNSRPVTAWRSNDVGQVVGWSYHPGYSMGTDAASIPIYPYRACVWQRSSDGTYNGVPTELPPLPGDTVSRAYSVNNTGIVAGSSQYVFYANGIQSVGEVHLVQWEYINGTWTPRQLPGRTPAVTSTVTPSLINSFGDVAGEYGSVSGSFFVGYNSPVFFDLGTLGGGSGRLPGLNDRAQMAGTSNNSKGQNRAFYWDTQRSSPLVMGTLGGSASWANGDGHSVSHHVMNVKGSVVGYSQIKGDRGLHGFVWVPGQSMPPVLSGTMYNLNDRTPSKGSFVELNGASAINDMGQIIGYGTTVSKKLRAFLLTPNQ